VESRCGELQCNSVDSMVRQLGGFQSELAARRDGRRIYRFGQTANNYRLSESHEQSTSAVGLVLHPFVQSGGAGFDEMARTTNQTLELFFERCPVLRLAAIGLSGSELAR
jgi:hypothetical protein